MLEDELRDLCFVRLRVDDRCLSFRGKTFNLKTGAHWNINLSPTEKLDFDVLSTSSLSFSLQEVSLIKRNEDFRFLIKNDPASRRLRTFDQRRKDVDILAPVGE